MYHWVAMLTTSDHRLLCRFRAVLREHCGRTTRRRNRAETRRRQGILRKALENGQRQRFNSHSIGVWRPYRELFSGVRLSEHSIVQPTADTR